MSKIGSLKITIEFVFFMFIMQFSGYSLETCCKLCILYFLMQLLIGRYQGKVLLMYDEIRLIILSHIGFFIGSFLVFPISTWTIKKFFGFVLLTCVLFIFAGCNSRYSHKAFRKWFKHNTLIVGVGHTAEKLGMVCFGNGYSLLDVIGFVNCNNSTKVKYIQQEQVVDVNKTFDLDSICSVIKEKNIDTVLIAIPEMDSEDLNAVFEVFKNKVDVIKYLPLVNGLVTFDTKVEDFDGILMISNSRGLEHFLSYALKRIMDICAGLCGLLLLIPLTIFVFIKNRKEGDKGPIFFTQNRIGKNGKEAERVSEILLNNNMIHFIATDAHSSTRRRPIIRETYDYIVRKYGEQKAEILFIQNPYKVIEDKEISIESPRKYEKSKGFFKKLFKK